MANEGKKEVEEVTKQAIDKGGLLVQLYFDMESDKQEDLQPLMVDLINNRLLKTPGVVYCVGAIDEPVKLKDTYSTSAQVTALIDSLWSLVNVMFTFSPAGIEILKPSRDYVLKLPELQTLLLNVSQISMEYNNYILSRVLKKEDYEKIQEQMKQREDLGKKLLEKKGQAPQEKK
ncbi:MAG: hypothetical protein KGH57_02105 [Candidatus Micrarchaeota archaeon]|nr:hypothetical protein [Candidatus Micrarchaeota archaeon]